MRGKDTLQFEKGQARASPIRENSLGIAIEPGRELIRGAVCGIRQTHALHRFRRLT
jgi:hypothetical protein